MWSLPRSSLYNPVSNLTRILGLSFRKQFAFRFHKRTFYWVLSKLSGQWILFADWQEAAGMRELEEEKKKKKAYAMGSLVAGTKLLCAPGFQRSLERGVKPLLSWAFKAQSLKSLSEQLLVITPQFVCVILSHWKYFVDSMNKGKHGLDKQDLRRRSSSWRCLSSCSPCDMVRTTGSHADGLNVRELVAGLANFFQSWRVQVLISVVCPTQPLILADISKQNH